MKTLILIALALSFNAYASTIVLTEGQLQTGDVAGNFKTKCADGNTSIECQSMAQILKVELKALLPLLRDSSHPENIKLFQNVMALEDSSLKSDAMMFLNHSYKPESKAGLIETAIEAMFGEDSFLANTASQILKYSQDPGHQELGDTFQRNNDSRNHSDISRHPEVYFNEWWFETTSFLDQYHIEKQKRFMAMDMALRVAYSPMGMDQAAAKGFLVEDKMASLIEHFKKVTNTNPSPSLAEIRKRTEVLAVELQEISRRMQRGDFSQVARLQVIQDEMMAYNSMTLKWSQLGIEERVLEKVTPFFILSKEDPELIDGAILLREWPMFGGTSIMYVQKFPAEAEAE